MLPDDVKALAVSVLAHRVLSAGYAAEGASDEREKVIQEILETLEVPI